MHIPTSTYRLQFNKDFTFKQAGEIIDYLDKLGISTIYSAPIFKSTPGSNHGYDVSDPLAINQEIGTEEELLALAGKLKQRGMTWLQDIVPNHMAYTPDNDRLMDVFERGSDSPYYSYFDIDWNHPDPQFKGKLMVPFLGKELSNAVEDAEVSLNYNHGRFWVNYIDTKYPLSTSAYEWLALNLHQLPLEVDSSIQKFLFRFHEKAAEKLSLNEWIDTKAALLEEQNPDEQAMLSLAMAVNSEPKFLLHLLDQQYYRLAFWRVTEKMISFRRFFTVNSLICLAMQDNKVFDEYHRYILELYNKGVFHGLRIDHIDGLQNPKVYIDQLREAAGDDCYIIAEKILEASEALPADWKLQGTSGYEFLAFVSQVLTDTDGGKRMLNAYHSLLGKDIDYKAMVFEKKSLILAESMQGELDNLMQILNELNLIPAETLASPQFREALGVFMAAFPVYRIYPDAFPLQNMELVDEAFEDSLKRAPHLAEFFEQLKPLFTSDHVSTEESENRIYFLKRMMQYTGPLAAKGVEDTTFYIYNALISHNEVGDSPEHLGMTIDDFHAKMIERRKLNPLSINATATHDTKRGEDARLRINILSELPEEWNKVVAEWRKMNSPLKKAIGGREVPSLNEEYFIYQSVIGGFPENLQVNEDFVERLKTYMNKVLREAKEHTGWSEPDSEYEEAVADFIGGLFESSHSFIESVLPFLKKVLQFASIYSLGQTLIKITAPGIPDTYQGCELWDLSYVDPDNRRAVDYPKRIQMLDTIASLASKTDELWKYLESTSWEGSRKLFLTTKALQFRKGHAQLFTEGEYIPLNSNDNLLAYARALDNQWVIVIVPLGISKAEIGQFDFQFKLPKNAPAAWKNILTGEEHNLMQDINVEELVSKFPVVFLSSVNQN